MTLLHRNAQDHVSDEDLSGDDASIEEAHQPLLSADEQQFPLPGDIKKPERAKHREDRHSLNRAEWAV